MSPLAFLQRRAALVPPPRRHLIRFHGVLAPHAELRAQMVARPTEDASEHAADHVHMHASPARLLTRVFEIDIEHCPVLAGVRNR